jgi:hypothetical protein
MRRRDRVVAHSYGWGAGQPGPTAGLCGRRSGATGVLVRRLQRAVDRLMVGALCLLGMAFVCVVAAFALVMIWAAWRIIIGVLTGASV